MKIRHIYIPLILLMLTCSGLFGIAASTYAVGEIETRSETKDVHALLIILGNDREIRDSVEKNEDMMLKMLRQLSDDCTVKMTLMKSESAFEGIITKTTFSNGIGGTPETNRQDIIRPKQVENWLANLKPKSQDTVLIYYSGHGEIGAFDTHYLLFDPGVSTDTLDREKLSQRLKQKPARLRMLITDTCSNLSRELPESAFKRLADVRERKRQNYPSDLFLKHEGFLDITAASPGQFAIAHDDLGGLFTSALLSHGFTAAADTNNDDFLEWQETFKKTKAQTKALYGQAEFDDEINADLRKNRQTTQEPVAYTLPKRIGGGGSGSPQTIVGQDGQDLMPEEQVAVVTTDKGIFVIEFYPDAAPVAVDNFIKLINEKFYDGLTFHRRVDEFVLQGGCPNGDGTGGPGWNIVDEYMNPNQRPHLRGTVAMAKTPAPNSSGSQFYICFKPQPTLDGSYTTFGRVIRGMDIVDRLWIGDVMTKIRLEAKSKYIRAIGK